ncbi:MAG: hypothetical protein KDK39_04585 [Leptospiraceae bacterium]|nr:hypothetical protein [Leptospiraceae bacterium]
MPRLRKALQYTAYSLLILAFLAGAATWISFESDYWHSSSDHPWENPAVFAINKLPARSSFRSFSSATDQRSSHPRLSIDLNGPWRFKWLPSVLDVPPQFNQTDFDDSQWPTLSVPSNWQMHGYGIPVYVNMNNPFARLGKMNLPHPFNKAPPHAVFLSGVNPPYVPVKRSPVGLYRRQFGLNDSQFVGRRLILHFDGVKSAMYVTLNGHAVGYSEGSMLPAEFDISPYVRTGNNQISVQVHRYSDGSFLEMQDMWRLSGIYRAVYIESVPRTHVFDVGLQTTIQNLKSGSPSALITVQVALNQKPQAATQLEWTLRHQGRVIESSDQPLELNQKQFSFQIPVRNPRLWNAEDPQLYSLEMRHTAAGQTEWIQQRFGLRTVSITGAQLMVNGQPILIKGINRHEMHPEKGQAIDRDDIRRDLIEMQKMHINAIRTSHYPNQTALYDLADEMGFYVVDETNLETHGISESLPASDPDWRSAVVDRARRMVLRDRNHPSIIIWSLGNESGEGDNFRHMRKAILELDKSRPIQYEQMSAVSDIIAPMYPSIAAGLPELPKDPVEETFYQTNQSQCCNYAIDQWGQNKRAQKPLIMCEYAHSMGNSLGNFRDYWQVIRRYPDLQGGFIWDWADQAFAATDAEGRFYWAYGRDLGTPDTLSDENFQNNGIVAADRSWHPQAWEVRQVYQPVQFRIENKQLILHNEFGFTNLKGASLQLDWSSAGRSIQSRAIRLPDIAAGVEWTVPEELYRNLTQSADTLLTIQLRANAALAGYQRDAIIARDQFELAGYPFTAAFSDSAPTDAALVAVNETEAYIELGSPGIALQVSKANGRLISIRQGGQSLLRKPAFLNFWRPVTENDVGDAGAFGNFDFMIWRTAARDAKLTAMQIIHTPAPRIEARFQTLGGQVQFTITYSIQGRSGIKLDVGMEADPALPQIPRVGWQLRLDPQFQSVAWYGRGPFANYADRKSAAFIGRYQMRVADLFHQYTVPQENANRSDVRTLSLEGERLQLDATMDQAFQFSAYPYTDANIENARHINELQPRDFVTLNLDARMKGVGGDTTWDARSQPHPQYRVKPGTLRFRTLLQLQAR